MPTLPEEADLSTVSEPAAEPYAVFTAWHCVACDVQGRSPADQVECWNCGGEVTITTQPTRIGAYESVGPAVAPVVSPVVSPAPAQRAGDGERAGSVEAGTDFVHPWG